MKYAFAGDRQISCNILEFLILKGHNPLALFVCDDKNESHSADLIALSNLDMDKVFVGKNFKSETAFHLLNELELDYIIGIHFPYIVPQEILEIPKIGFINLHPAYLPYNKGWHTPSWAIIEGYDFGATLHFMSEKLDEGDIIHQKKIKIELTDTANSLYQKTLLLEEQVFYESFESLTSLNPNKIKQTEVGTSHQKKDLEKIRKIEVNQDVNPLVLIDKIRALTTNNINESAYIEIDGKKIGMQIKLVEINE
jgi:methionyl-tRNA formyltransferase